MAENINEIQSKENQGAQQEKTQPGINAGNEPAPVDIVERARTERILLEAENKRLEQNIVRLEKLRSEQILGGGSLAGTAEKTSEQKEADTDQAYADRMMAKYFPVRKVRL